MGGDGEGEGGRNSNTHGHTMPHSRLTGGHRRGEGEEGRFKQTADVHAADTGVHEGGVGLPTSASTTVGVV